MLCFLPTDVSLPLRAILELSSVWPPSWKLTTKGAS
uniref:Uncharacterized protein n=1 Tax=Rhizophora mucronata TaxID=61149 RepID=A0A2P2QAW4_RHIMU